MKVLVTVKHIGIKKLLLPALAKIKGIKFDVFIHHTSGLLPEDDYSNLNIITHPDPLSVAYPKGNDTLVNNFGKVGINLNSYDAFIIGGLSSIPYALSEFKKKLIIYTVAPLYRAQLNEEMLKVTMSKRNKNSVLVVHSAPTHYIEYKKRYENKYMNNTMLLAHGLNPDSWGTWNGHRKEVLTIWGNYNLRIVGKLIEFKDGNLKGDEAIKKSIGGYKHRIIEGVSEEIMRQELRDNRIHFMFMKDQQTVGLVESMRIGIPIVGTAYNLVDPLKFLKYGHDSFFTINGDDICEEIDNLMFDHNYAKRISKNLQETCDECFNFNLYVNNWERILKGNKPEQPKIYKEYK